jgi:hypothetical protein
MAPKRILIVEGQAAFATVHAAEVEKADYEAVLVHNGATSLSCGYL